MINVNGITKRYGDTVAVRDISFQVPAGQVLGFLGPNGAGKSTTMRVLTGYMPADEGTATIAGYDIFSQSLEVRKRIGYLPESAPLYLDMEVPDFLKFIARIRKIPGHKIQTALDRIVDLCGLGGMIHKKIGELSKGYRQRVGLAQAMIHDPDILVLDEPTSGLDPNQIVEIRELIKSIGKEKTVILSTHILPEVTATCDRILIIHEGELVADGTPDDLVSQGSGDVTLYATIVNPSGSPVDELSVIPGVRDIQSSIPNGSDDHSMRLVMRLTGNKDQAQEVFKFAVEKGWILSELHTESATLEDIFAKLTT